MTLIDPQFNNTFGSIQKIDTGLYEIDHFNMDMMLSKKYRNLQKGDNWEGFYNLNSLIRGIEDSEITLESTVIFIEDSIGYISSYGVCDSPEQFMESLGKLLSDSKEKFCVSFTCIKKEDQPDWGGWRWHKWGPYIGKGSPQHEYLYHEKLFDKVYCYHIYHKV